MAVRAFLADGSEIRVPAHPGIDPIEGLSIWAILRPGDRSAFEAIMRGVDSEGDQQWAFGMDNLNQPFFFVADGNQTCRPTDVPTLGTTDHWLLGYSKGDTAAGAFHFKNLTSGVWSHTPGDIVGTANFPRSMVGGYVAFGEPGGDELHARLSVAGLDETSRDDETWETVFDDLSSETARIAFATGSAWNFNQTTNTDSIPCLCGNATTITGTIDDDEDRNGITGTTIVFGDDPPAWDFTTTPPALRVTFRYSGGAANQDPALSIGGAESAHGEQIATGLAGVLLDVMRDFPRPDAITGITVHRGIYLHVEDNGFATPAELDTYLDLDLIDGVTFRIGAAPEGPGGTMELLDAETDAPADVEFSVPTDLAPLELGETASDTGAPLWIEVTLDPNILGGLGNSAVIHVNRTPL